MSLSPHARNALAALGDVEPTAGDERRVREELERTLGVVLPVAAVTAGAVAASAAATSAATSAATGASAGGSLFGLGVGAKVVLFVAAVGVGAVATVGVKTVVQRAPQPAVAVVVKPVVAVAPVASRPVVEVPAPVAVEPAPVVVPDVDVEPAAEAPVVTAVAPKSPRPQPQLAVAPVKTEPAVVATTPAVPETPEITPPPVDLRNAVTLENADSEMSFSMVVEAHFASCDAATEGKTARAARKLLMDSRAEHALFLLSAYQKQCPSGHWSDEAWRVRLSSLCKLDRDSEAAGLFDWFVTEYPGRRVAIESELRSTCSPAVLDTER